MVCLYDLYDWQLLDCIAHLEPFALLNWNLYRRRPQRESDSLKLPLVCHSAVSGTLEVGKSTFAICRRSNMIFFFNERWLRSIFPWDCGGYGEPRTILTSRFQHKDSTHFLNSPPLSHCRTRGGPNSRYKVERWSATNLLVFRVSGLSHIYLLNTSCTVRMYRNVSLFNCTGDACMSTRSI